MIGITILIEILIIVFGIFCTYMTEESIYDGMFAILSRYMFYFYIFNANSNRRIAWVHKL